MSSNAKALKMNELENVFAGTAITAGSSMFNSGITCDSHHKKMYFTGKMWERPLLGFIGWWTEHMNEYYCPDCGRTFDIQEDVYDRKVGELYY